jgi:hypothetical protein
LDSFTRTMQRVALQVGAFVLALLASVRAFAHGEPPVAYGVLWRDAEGPKAVSLSAGVALRVAPQRYQFVCPGAWLDQFSAPLAALADGTIVVGATRGLMLLDELGNARPHPDPAASGRSSELVRSARGVFALRAAQSGSELLAVDAQTVRVLWQDSTSWSAVVALEDRLVLMRAANRLLELVAVSALDGSELERSSAQLELPVDRVFARAHAGLAYALLLYRDGTMALGGVTGNAFSKLADGALSIAGPLSAPDATLLALDGQLVQLRDGTLSPLLDAHQISCLLEHDGLRYACERDGISELNGQDLGAPLFRFDWLEAPALERVVEGEPRMLCTMQWQDYLLDRQLSMPEAGSGGVPSAGAGGAQPMAAGAGAGPELAPARRGTGCAVQPRRHLSSRGATPYMICAWVVWTVLRSRNKQRS